MPEVEEDQEVNTGGRRRSRRCLWMGRWIKTLLMEGTLDQKGYRLEGLDPDGFDVDWKGR